jgi:hypothetical protein
LQAAEVNVIARSPHFTKIHGPGIPGPRMSISNRRYLLGLTFL